MIRLELSGEDAATMTAVIENQLSDLSYEIANTDSFDYRETLKKKRATLNRVLEGLSVPRQRV